VKIGLSCSLGSRALLFLFQFFCVDFDFDFDTLMFYVQAKPVVDALALICDPQQREESDPIASPIGEEKVVTG
jgi:hypothetical protein